MKPRTKESIRARASTIPHRAHLATTRGFAARKAYQPPFRLPPSPYPRPDRLREARSGFGLRLRLREDRRKGMLGYDAQTPTRRVDRLGVLDALHEVALEAYDRMVGLEPSELAVDSCITKAPCGGEKAGRSPVDRGKRGIKRSVVVDGKGI